MCNAKRNNARLQQDGMSEQTFENTKASLDARAIILQSAVRDALTLRFRIPTACAFLAAFSRSSDSSEG